MKWTDELKKSFLAIYSGNGCNISNACEACGVSRQSFYEAKKADGEFAQNIVDSRESIIDNVETALYKEAMNGNTTAQIFILKTIGKERGYVETHEFKIPTPVGFDPSKLSDDELKEYLALREKMMSNATQ